MKLRLAATAAGSVMVLGACAEGPKTDDFGYEGTGIQFSVAPLTLDSLADACYSFAITNEAGDPVVGRGPGTANLPAFAGLLSGTELNTVCASQFGNGDGGDLSYVAPCDAQEPEHTVTLWVDALCSAAVTDKAGDANWEAASPNGASTICDEIQPYQNPCGTTGCQLTVTCVENADTPVTFNFTIMGQADQGFFDIAVNFEDIFCSAKVDCQRADGDVNTPLELLHNPYKPGSPRDLSFIVARACTAGPGETTQMYSSRTYLMCGNDISFSTAMSYFQPFFIAMYDPMSADEGNLGHGNLTILLGGSSQTPLTTGDWTLSDPGTGTDFLALSPAAGNGNFQSFPITTAMPWDANVTFQNIFFQNGVYHGNEALEQGGENLGKVYWNHAVGVDWAQFQNWMTFLDGLGYILPVDAPPVSRTRCKIVSNLIVTDDQGLPPAPNLAGGEYTSYPNVYSEVTFWQAGDGSETLRCTQHALNAGGAKGGVRPVYNFLHYGYNFTTPGDFRLVRPWGQAPVSFSPYCMQGDGMGSTLLTVCP